MQKKAFDGATFNAAGGAYAMQGNIAAGYDFPYQEAGLATIAIAETMKQVHPIHNLLTSKGTCAARADMSRSLLCNYGKYVVKCLYEIDARCSAPPGLQCVTVLCEIVEPGACAEQQDTFACGSVGRLPSSAG